MGRKREEKEERRERKEEASAWARRVPCQPAFGPEDAERGFRLTARRKQRAPACMHAPLVA